MHVPLRDMTMCQAPASQIRQKRLLKRRENGASQGAGKKPSLYRSHRETVRHWHNLLWRCRDWIAAPSGILCRVLRNADSRHCCFIAVKFVTHPERTGIIRADALSHPSFPFVHISGTPVRQSLVEAVPDGAAVDIPARNAKQGMDARPVVLDG